MFHILDRMIFANENPKTNMIFNKQSIQLVAKIIEAVWPIEMGTNFGKWIS